MRAEVAARTDGEQMLSVAASKLQPLLALARDAGIDPAALLSEAGLEPPSAAGLEQRIIGLADYFRVLEKLAAAAHDETWKLSTRPLLPGATTFVLSHLSDCGTLHDAMQRIAQAYNHLHGGAYNRVERKNNRLLYVIDDRDFPYAIQSDVAHIQFTMDCVLIFLHSMLALISGDPPGLRVAKVYTRRTKQSDDAKCLQFWNASLRWDSEYYALVYDGEAAALPVVLPHGEPPGLHAIYRKAVQLIAVRQSAVAAQPDTTERVVEALENGHTEQRRIAARLGTSVATLRRRLQEEGTSFRDIRRVTLNASARALLKQGRHVSDVAEMLGFSDFRSFNRAFKSWNGVTPKRYAAQHQRRRPART